jgi:hypothetical protein
MHEHTHIIKTLLVSHGKIQTSLQLVVWPAPLAQVLPRTFNGRLASFAPQVQTSWNQANAPFLLESFPKRSRIFFFPYF